MHFPGSTPVPLWGRVNSGKSPASSLPASQRRPSALTVSGVTQTWDPGPRPTTTGSRWKSTAYAPLAIGCLKCACPSAAVRPAQLTVLHSYWSYIRTVALSMLMMGDYSSRDLLVRQAESMRPLRLDVRGEGGNAEEGCRAGRKSEVSRRRSWNLSFWWLTPRYCGCRVTQP